VARRRFQKGQLFKSGKRRKVWVGRWREDVMREDGTTGELRRWQVLGTLADLPTRREAQTLLDERLRTINAGASRPEALINFGTFVEQQWKTLVLPTFKPSTQHGYKPSCAFTCFLRGGSGGSATSSVSQFSNGLRTSSAKAPDGRRCGMRGCCCRASLNRRSNTGTSKRILHGA
jgi:hypothetical protein